MSIKDKLGVEGWRFEPKGNEEENVITPEGINKGRYGRKAAIKVFGPSVH